MKQLYKHTKLILALSGVLFLTCPAFGQTAHTEYFMSPSYFKSSLNPAFRPSRGYIGIPGLTNLSLEYRTNSLMLDKFLFPGVGENGKAGLFLHENVSYDKFMNGISDRNYLNLDINETLLGFGIYVKDAFLTFDASLRADVEVNIPKGVFAFLKEFKNDKRYNLSGISTNAIAYGQIGLGGSYPFLSNSLLVGAKVKFLLGLTNFQTDFDKLTLRLGNDKWTIETVQASIRYAMKGLKPKYSGGNDTRFDGFNSDDAAIGLCGFGLGLDLGAAFKPAYLFEDYTPALNNFTVSAAITDLGFISWDKNNSAYLEADARDITVTGIDKEIDVENAEDIFDGLNNAVKDIYDFRERPTKTAGPTRLKAKLNYGIEYAFPKNHINVGVFSTTYFNATQTISECTIGGSIKPIDLLEAGLSYSFVYGGFRTAGFSLHLGQYFYIASDYIFPQTNSQFLPVSAKAFNFHMGFAVPFGATYPLFGAID